MKSLIPAVFVALVAASVPLGGAGAADLKTGIAAFHRGDYKAALKEWRTLAKQGNAAAQNNIAYMYSKGLGLPHDHVRAHMWWSIAAAHGGKRAARSRDIIARDLDKEELAEARRLARDWLEKHGKKPR